MSNSADLASSGPDSNSGPMLNAVTFSLLGLSAVLVSLRCYVRLVMIKAFGWDDAMIVTSLIFLVANDALIAELVSAGVGQHLLALPNPGPSLFMVIKGVTLGEFLSVTGAFFNRLSIALFLLKIKSTKAFKIAIWGIIVPLGIMTVVLDLASLLQCIPLVALWTPGIPRKCYSAELPLNMSYAQSAFAIIADLFLALSPVAILWNVQISLRKKIGVCGLMSLGLIATVANVMRNILVPQLALWDITRTIVPILIVPTLELSLGIIGACIPTLVPLITHRRSRTDRKEMSSGLTDDSIPAQIPPRAAASLPKSTQNFEVTVGEFDDLDNNQVSMHSIDP